MAQAARIRESLPKILRDNGDIEPISQMIRPEKRVALRHSRFHPYFTSFPSNVVRAYIEKHTEPDELVLDPFGGTGVTAVEALALSRRVVSIDINPLATLITRAKVVPVDLKAAKQLFEQMTVEVERQIRETDDWDEARVVDELQHHWYPTTRIPEYVDQDHCETVDRLFFPRQLLGHALIREWISRHVRDEGLGLLFSTAFSASVLKANKTYWVPSDRSDFRGQSRIFQHFKLSIPKSPTYLDPWETFARRFHSAMQAKQDAMRVIGDCDACRFQIITGPAQKETAALAASSVDYVFTDPPYGANIAYLDLSVVSTSWLELEVTESDYSQEIIEAGSRHKTRDAYLADLDSVLTETARVLKKGRMLSLVYAHKEPAIWSGIVGSARRHTLEIATVNVQPTNLPSVTKIKNPATTLSGGLIVNFRKVEGTGDTAVAPSDLPNIPTYLINEAKAAVVKFLGATTDEIFYNAYSKLLKAGFLGTQDEKSLTSVLRDLEHFFSREMFLDDSGFWQLKPDAVIPPSVEMEDCVRYLAFLKLYIDGPSSLEELIDFIYVTLARQRSGLQTKLNLLDTVRELARRDDGVWRLNEDLIVQLKLPMEATSAYVTHWGEHLKTDFARRLQSWRSKSIFTAPSFDFEPTNSSDLRAVLYGGRKREK